MKLLHEQTLYHLHSTQHPVSTLHPATLYLTQSSSSLDIRRHLLQRSQFVLIRRLGKVSNLCDVDSGRAPIVLYVRVSVFFYLYMTTLQRPLTRTQIRKPVQLIVPIWRCVGAVLRNDKAVCRQCLGGLAAEHIAFHEYLIIAAAVYRLV